MTVVRDVMRRDAPCVGEHETLLDAARRMIELDVRALPIRGDDDRLHGLITASDIAVQCLAAGRDPAMTTAGDLAQEVTFTVGADADVSEALRLMDDHDIRQLPVIDDHRLVGMIYEPDLGKRRTRS